VERDRHSAHPAGARVIITSSSDEKLARTRALGADETINYRTTPAWDAEVLALTGGAGADLVVETIGAATFPQSLNAVAIAGTIFVVGFVGGTEITIPLLPINLKTTSIVGNNTGSTANLTDGVRGVAMAGIKPAIDRVFAFDAKAPPILAKWPSSSTSDFGPSSRKQQGARPAKPSTLLLCASVQ
jgi:NADPH:quinone reductase-like Zn-dependent oxidoreductase